MNIVKNKILLKNISVSEKDRRKNVIFIATKMIPAKIILMVMVALNKSVLLGFFDNSLKRIGPIPKSINFERIVIIARRLANSPNCSTPRYRAASRIEKKLIIKENDCPPNSEKKFFLCLLREVSTNHDPSLILLTLSPIFCKIKNDMIVRANAIIQLPSLVIITKKEKNIIMLIKV